MTDTIETVEPVVALQGTVANRIRTAMDQLSAKERQVARVILAQYPAAGLETTAALSALAKVSGPTVVRFVARLGYASYRDFQSELRQELNAKTASPLTKTQQLSGEGTIGGFVSSVSTIFDEGLRQTFADLPESELEKALELLADPDLKLHLIGGRFSRILADYFALTLQPMRPGVSFYPDAHAAQPAFLDMRRRDCVVVFDFRRYQADIIALARHARANRARIILITDPWMSPIAELADVVLTARVEAPSQFDSHVSSMAVVETLVAGISQRLGATAADRIRSADSLTRLLET